MLLWLLNAHFSYLDLYVCVHLHTCLHTYIHICIMQTTCRHAHMRRIGNHNATMEISPWGLVQVVKGWGGFVGGSRFQVPMGQKFTYPKKKEKKMLQWKSDLYVGSQNFIQEYFWVFPIKRVIVIWLPFGCWIQYFSYTCLSDYIPTFLHIFHCR